MCRKIIIIIVFCFILLITNLNIYAVDIDDVAAELNLDSIMQSLTEYTSEQIDVLNMTEDLIAGEGLDYGVLGNFVLDKLFGNLKEGLKLCISILIVLILMAIIKGIELEKDNTVSNVANLAGFLIIVAMALKGYYIIIKSFIDTIELLTGVIQIVAPFLLSILIATGEVATSGIVGPVLLFVTSLIGVLITYVIVPLISLSLVFRIVSNMSNTLKLDKFAGLFSSTSMWIISVVFALFIGVLELESSLTTSIDQVTVKTTQTAVSNLIPVVGKFVSDSLEVVMGASEIIGKTVGIVTVVTMIVLALIPIIKLLIYSFMYYVISAISELLNADNKITMLCIAMSKQYKTMLGIMVGVIVTFVIGIGIVINLMGRVVG